MVSIDVVIPGNSSESLVGKLTNSSIVSTKVDSLTLHFRAWFKKPISFLSGEICKVFPRESVMFTDKHATPENKQVKTFKGAMSRIVRLLVHHSFGAKSSLERQNVLNQAYKSWPPSSFSFPPQLDINLSSNWQVRVRNYRPNNKKRIRKQQII